MPSKVMVVLSGGLDSTTLAYHLEAQGWQISAISFDYGQRHGVRELNEARYHADQNGWPHSVIDMRNIGQMLSSVLISSGLNVPEGHYAEENMKATIVPNRNALMMSAATGIALSNQIPYIATAVHAGDHPIYPDCRGEFITALSDAFRLGNEGFMGIIAPFVNLDKQYIAQRAVDLGFEITRTWSCYKGGQKHCGKCGTCVERMEALWGTTLFLKYDGVDRAEMLFPKSLYEDNQYWHEVTKEAHL